MRARQTIKGGSRQKQEVKDSKDFKNDLLEVIRGPFDQFKNPTLIFITLCFDFFTSTLRLCSTETVSGNVKLPLPFILQPIFAN